MKLFFKFIFAYVSVILGIVFLVVSLVILDIIGCSKEEAVEFAEFKVTDVSQPVEFIDSISSRKCDNFLMDGYVKMSATITGELDGRAKVLYGVGPDTTIYLNHFFIEKGEKINFQTEGDHYNDKLWLRFEPLDCKKGHLTIRTKIH
ncbi:hypothetical protein [Runella limosa]|uniref:hypothetical protein n=1 Tax=Runella limosa TaxID=370978 RepID=UPI00048B74F0|nr:hypothetical protein [Runella limosa]